MKTLIAYFSASGETKKLAHTLVDIVKGDLFEIKPETSYTAADLDWHDKASRSSVEMRDTSCRPAMAVQADVTPYDTIFVGFPIWWYEAPRIIETFLESCDLTGKTVIPFATSGGSDLGNTDSILHRSAPQANWKLGRRLKANATAQEVAKWVHDLALKA